MNMTKMGAFLQSLRKEKGLTQEQPGETLHISSKTISRWGKIIYSKIAESDHVVTLGYVFTFPHSSSSLQRRFRLWEVLV